MFQHTTSLRNMIVIITLSLLVLSVVSFAYSLDQDQAQQTSGLTKLFDTLMVFLIYFCEKGYFEKNQQTTKSVKN